MSNIPTTHSSSSTIQDQWSSRDQMMENSTSINNQSTHAACGSAYYPSPSSSLSSSSHGQIWRNNNYCPSSSMAIMAPLVGEVNQNYNITAVIGDSAVGVGMVRNDNNYPVMGNMNMNNPNNPTMQNNSTNNTDNVVGDSENSDTKHDEEAQAEFSYCSAHFLNLRMNKNANPTAMVMEFLANQQPFRYGSVNQVSQSQSQTQTQTQSESQSQFVSSFPNNNPIIPTHSNNNPFNQFSSINNYNAGMMAGNSMGSRVEFGHPNPNVVAVSNNNIADGCLMASSSRGGQNQITERERKEREESLRINDKTRKNTRIGKWTIDEHKRFLLGLEHYGKGSWSDISKNFVKTRDTVQVASHAQKYFNRREKSADERRRPSIHDITNADPNQANLIIATTSSPATLPPLPYCPPPPPAAPLPSSFLASYSHPSMASPPFLASCPLPSSMSSCPLPLSMASFPLPLSMASCPLPLSMASCPMPLSMASCPSTTTTSVPSCTLPIVAYTSNSKHSPTQT